MKLRLLALLAVPALALGFAFASPATDQAQAIPPIPAAPALALGFAFSWAAQILPFIEQENLYRMFS